MRSGNVAMHIKKLEICGFKSFVDRTVIHFDHDMIGVVGPNGCGKSNVVDAIRWAMGEQSAKALRGRSMGDVIFSGSESRQYAGFAEVTITFDNADGGMAQQLPLEYRDYAELAVTRRLFRGDGSNEYLINKVPVRLRDVTEVFLGTGVGRKAYSIVEQGKIGLIVSTRAEDRRVLIEEAAGITKYKARKRQAENKMALTRTNLTRVGDIVSEIGRQIDSLRRQAAKAKRYVRYREELDDLMLWDASHKLLGLVACTTVSEHARASAAERVTAERAAVDARDAEIEVMRQQTHDAEQVAERTQNAAFMSDNEVREWQTQIERLADRYSHLDQRLAGARAEQSALEGKADELADERDGTNERLELVVEEQQAEEQKLQVQSERLEALRLIADECAEQLASLQRRHALANAAIARGEAALSGFVQRSADMKARQERLAEERARLTTEHTGLDDRRAALSQQARDLTLRKHAMCDARDALQVELPSLQEGLKQGGQRLEQARAALHRRQSRLAALEELAERMEGIGAGARNLLETGDAALGGLVADRIDVRQEATAAFAGLVGDRLQCVVVHDLDRALVLLRDLATDRRGRATVIAGCSGASAEPKARTISESVHSDADTDTDSGSDADANSDTDAAPDTDTDRSAPRHEVAADESIGLLGEMIDQVRFAPEDARLVRMLVGDALLVRTADDAQRLTPRLTHGDLGDRDLVTLDGTVFHTDGRITGGAGDAFAAGLLEQKREMRELREVVAVEGVEVNALADSVEAQRERLAKLREALDQAKSEAHEAEIAMVTGEQDLRRIEQQLDLVAKRSDEVAAELEELESAICGAQSDHQRSVTELDEAVQSCDDLHARLTEAEQRASESRQQHAEQQQLVTELKVRLASVRERTSAETAALARVEQQHAELCERIDELEAERNAGATEAGRIAAQIFEARSKLGGAKNAQRNARAAAESARGGLDDARHSLALREADLREMRAALDAVSEELRTHEMEVQRLRLERNHLDEAIRERFRGLELATVVGDFHARPMVDEEQRNRIRELTRLIERMGSVNLDAMSEYEQAAERFEFFTSQKADLEKALADLEKAIAQMNRESRRLFKHAFDGINRRFKDLFPKMFRGGKAELRLTNPEDLLETGIDILAQPPGKRLGNIELMSGGEKAFTAVSLLFAIFRYKPSPFCILDEVDAPLDDANIDRYVEAIRAMTDRSQFILVTHSKRTMQSVDVLYGVTMQEPGVSKLVGVRVNEGAKRSATRNSSAPPGDDHAEQEQQSPSAGSETKEGQLSGSESDAAAVA